MERKCLTTLTLSYSITFFKKLVVPGGGFEPPQAICPPAPQAGASTYSAIPAKKKFLVYSF
jgi:hypothetical protein